MPVDYDILPEKALVVVRYSGFVSGAEQMAALQQYLQDPLYSTGQSIFLDFEPALGIDVDFTKMMKLVSVLAPLFDARAADTSVAGFAPSDMAFGTVRMFQTLLRTVSRQKVGVFRTRTETLSFLGLPREICAKAMAEA